MRSIASCASKGEAWASSLMVRPLKVTTCQAAPVSRSGEWLAVSSASEVYGYTASWHKLPVRHGPTKHHFLQLWSCWSPAGTQCVAASQPYMMLMCYRRNAVLQTGTDLADSLVHRICCCRDAPRAAILSADGPLTGTP